MASLVKKTIKGIDYWYLIQSKRVDGKVKKCILEYFGNTKAFTNTLLNYSQSNQTMKSYSHGDTFSLLKIARKLQIEELLDEVFPQKTRDGFRRSSSLMLLSLQYACCPGSKNQFADWVKNTTLPFEFQEQVRQLTSHHFWEQMDGITAEEIHSAEDAITKRIFALYHFEMEKLALDYTNYFTYIDSSNEKSQMARRGKNKQKRNDLKQLSLALITTKETGLPICSYVYEENKNDQTIFFEYVDQVTSRISGYNPKSMTLILDGGSNNKKNFERLTSHYICSFSLHFCKELYDIDIRDYLEMEVQKKVILYYRTQKEIWGKERECILLWSENLYKGQVKELQETMAKATLKLEELKEKLENPKSKISKKKQKIEEKINTILNKPHMDELFQIEYMGDEQIQTITYTKNDIKREEICRKYYGKKLLITDHCDWDAYEIVKTYREQDVIEKIFRDTKNRKHFSIRPQYHWTDQKIRVHIFCCLLGLTIATILQKEVADQGMKLSKNELMEELSNIREAWVKQTEKEGTIKVTKLIEEMDETQSKLWNIVTNI